MIVGNSRDTILEGLKARGVRGLGIQRSGNQTEHTL